MNPSLNSFRDEFRGKVLELLWRQWNALGVSGTEPVWAGAMIDPEALLLFSLHIARYDARLFQEMVDWLVQNGSWINIQRLNNMIAKYGFAGAKTLAPVAARLAENDSSRQLKWKRLAAPPESVREEPLFFLPDGCRMPLPRTRDELFGRYGFVTQPLSLRGYSRPFDPSLPANRLPVYRAFFGVNSRSELLCVLGSQRGVTAASAARLTGYSPRSIQNVLAEMAASGWVEAREGGREKVYSLRSDPNLTGLFKPAHPEMIWILWPAVFQCLEKIWIRLFSGKLDALDSLALDSEFFRLWMECRKILPSGECGGFFLSAPKKTLDGAMEAFVQTLRSALHATAFIERFRFEELTTNNV
jgi:hypothetical protein